MQALEDLRAKVRSVKSRRYVDEAIAAYSAGALRAAIISLWIAVVADVIEKTRALSDDGGVPAAAALVKKLNDSLRAAAKGSPADLQSFERGILEAARDQLHLIGRREYVELRRLREDRNLCAHPAFTSDDEELFAPSAELVRSHLTAAIDGLLAHGAVSGRKAIERFAGEVSALSFPRDEAALIEYLDATYWRRGTPSLRNDLVRVSCKGTLEDSAVNDRWQFTRVLRALHVIAPGPVESEVAAHLQRRQDTLDDDGLWRLAAGLCYLPATWECLHDGVRRRLEQLVAIGPIERLLAEEMFDPPPAEPLRGHVLARLSDAVRYTADRRELISMGRPTTTLIAPLIDILRSADSYKMGTSALRWLNGLSAELDETQLDDLLTAACENDQIYLSVLCRQEINQLALARPVVKELPPWDRWIHTANIDREH